MPIANLNKVLNSSASDNTKMTDVIKNNFKEV